jgi:hypothetical protein
MLNLLGDSENLQEGLSMCPQFSNFYFFWISISPRNTAKGVDTSRRCINNSARTFLETTNKENIKTGEPRTKLSNFLDILKISEKLCHEKA